MSDDMDSYDDQDIVVENIDGLGEFVIYTTEDGSTEVHLRVVDETVWMTPSEISRMFDVTTANVSTHLRNIYAEGELTRDRTSKKFLQVRSEGDRTIRRTVAHYNLDAILAVGYRVRGTRGIQFRTWASTILSEYLIKGFAMNDEKLKDPRGADYFDELLARIRDIRTSEKRLSKQILDVFALCADYDKDDPRCTQFFQRIQNKLHYAVTGQTAGEIIATRCDPTADNLGLTTFKNDKALKADALTAKNYLTHDELERLNRFTDGFLTYAQDQAKGRKVVYMDDWLARTDKFIEFNDYEALHDSGRIQMDKAKELAAERYALFDAKRRGPVDAQIEAEQLDQLQTIERQILTDRKRLAPRTRE
ncbi:RhuM family protein [uncultured Corynebacterium sp.]|uniref:RhuM family protein n=1 Tax=uncultured Corynebacterium sp. TaxID=159447 RepID=UPI0025FFDE0C|nr:RhuM family protein [uncultured Corynebacterium sp.]